MADFEIDELDRIGIVKDLPAAKLPPEAWTIAENMRFGDGSATRLPGHTEVFPSAAIAPHYALPVPDAAQHWWLYTSLTAAYVWNGTTHTDITRASGVYTASNSREWNGGVFQGVPYMNNGVDDPQYWAAYSTGQLLQDLANWPANTLCKVMRPFGSFLVALSITKSGVISPHMVKWSHRADPGSLPSSWDETDPTKDTGEFELSDVESGLILDGLRLGSRMIIYKEGSVWAMRHVGGRAIFGFDPIFEANGLLSIRGVALTADGTRHVALMQDDVIVHDGQNITASLESRAKKHLFNQIDTDNYLNCFLFTDPVYNEVWVCYPSSGNTNPNRALILSFQGSKLEAVGEADIGFRNAVTGTLEEAADDTWATVTGTWAEQIGPWSQAQRRKVVVCTTDDTKFHQLNSGTTHDGTAFTGTLQRTSIALTGKTNRGQPIVDFKQVKQYNRVWIEATGGPIDVRLGTQDKPKGAITWDTTQSFDPETDLYLDFTQSGRAICVEFSAAVAFAVQSYKVELHAAGSF